MHERHLDICARLSGEDASKMSHQQQAALSREAGELQTVLQLASQLQKVEQEVLELKALEHNTEEDQELRHLAEQERHEALIQVSQLQERITGLLLPKDPADDRNVILEVRAGTGGEEASIFASDLFQMYAKAAPLLGWRFEPIEIAESEASRGYKMASASISGSAVYGQLKHESGTHRVQRVPVTESSGRIHTSAASVAVLPEADEVEVGVRDEDIRIDTYRSSGAGGQHVNTTNSAVRITHLPTGIAVAIQDERSQHKNKAKALKVLRARLYEQERLQQQQKLSADRKGLIGSGDRSERIRTYNFPQGRVTDHRIGLTEHNLEAVMSGERLHVFIEALLERHKTQLLETLTA